MAIPRAFLDRVADPAPALRVKFAPDSDEPPRTVEVAHHLGKRPTAAGREYLATLAGYPALGEFLGFYRRHDGVQFGKAFNSLHDEERPLLELVPAGQLAGFTDRYGRDGDRGWTMDLNTSKSLYRGRARWLAFAEVGSGPAGLTIFLDGPNAGGVFLATPQPWFNILRPVAKGFHALLDRIAGDAPGFLRLVRALVSLRGVDGVNYGLVPVEYLPDGGKGQKRLRRAGR